MSTRFARFTRRTGVGTAALLATGALVAPSTVADEKPHCAVDARTGAETCFATLPEALDAAKSGQGNGPRVMAGDVIQGTFFDDPQYGGSSLTVYGTAPCEKDGWVNYQYDLPDDWKNRISSVQPWANCWLWLYPEPNLGGDRDGPFEENAPDIGAFMNDRTQSIGFS